MLPLWTMGERFCFGIEKGETDEFLRPYGFEVEKIMDADTLENLFFRNAGGKIVCQVNKTHCIVTAIKK